jgi:hypothetical protein
VATATWSAAVLEAARDGGATLAHRRAAGGDDTLVGLALDAVGLEELGGVALRTRGARRSCVSRSDGSSGSSAAAGPQPLRKDAIAAGRRRSTSRSCGADARIVEFTPMDDVFPRSKRGCARCCAAPFQPSAPPPTRASAAISGVSGGSGTLIAMDAPPDAKLRRLRARRGAAAQAGLNAPEVIAQDLGAATSS